MKRSCNPILALGAFLCIALVMPGLTGKAAAADDFLIAVDEYSRVYYAAGNGNGTFSGYTQIDFLGGADTRAAIVADFDNDGYADFIAGRGVGGTAYYYLFLNDGSNHFTKTAMVGTLSNANSWAMDMAAGDFNNDGNMDFAANGNQSTTGIYLGDGKGQFVKTEVDWGAYGRGMDTADFDHDGNIDIVRARYSSGYIDVHRGDGTGAFDPTGDRIGDTGNDPYGVVAGDFDNDGHPDVIANSGSGGDPYFFKGNGDGTFQGGVYEASLDLNNHGGFDAFDYNRDGNLDVIIANHTGRTVYFYPGKGDGTFDDSAVVTIGTTVGYCMGISALPQGPPTQRPVAAIDPAAPAPITAGGSVDFDGSGSSDADGSIVSWDWAFGDGNTDSAENPAAHTFGAEGTYTTRLTVTDDDGKIDVAPARVIAEGREPTVDTSAVTFGESDASYGVWELTLEGADYAADTEGLSGYQWDFGDGLSEGFEDGDAAGWQAYSGTWSIEEIDPVSGSYAYRQSDAAPDRTWNLFEKYFSSDLVIEADVHMVSGSGEEVQVLFRGQDKDNNYEFILRGRGQSDVLLYRRVNGSATNVYEYDLPSTFSSYPIDVGYTYNIKIVCTGSLIQFYLDGRFLFAFYDGTFADGKVGLSTYRTDAIFDNVTVSSTATGQYAGHRFAAGTYDVLLTATDTAGQDTSGTIPMTMAAGDPPTADAGGSYAVGEDAAWEGGWTVNLDGSGSSDDVEIQTYVWDLGTDTFDGTVVNEGKWVHNGYVSQDGALSVSHPDSGWGERYFFSKDTYTRAPGMAFEARVKQVSQNAMVGFKNTNNTFHYNQMPYAIYFSDGNLYIYEDGISRGDTGYNYSYNTWYDIRIALKETQGARYYYRLSGNPDWILLYDSDYGTATEFKRGVDVYQSTFVMDDVREIAAGVTPAYRFYGQAVHPVSLTVTDRAGQSDTANTHVTTTGALSPTAAAGLDVVLDESDASGGVWTGNFDASGSSDDFGIYTYEWDWDYDGSVFDPSGDTGVSASHTWNTPGTYAVALRVTDHALQSHIDEVSVTVENGGPPVADAGGPYAADETTGTAYQGAWEIDLDGSGSNDDTGIERYFWNLGVETFDGDRFNGGKWNTNGGVSQDGSVAVTGANNWNNRYIVSRGIVPNEKGQVFQARFKSVGNGQCMFGFKNSGTNYHYNQYPYEFYIYNNNIRIYENSNYRGDTGYNVSNDTWYDFRIERTSSGAVYSYKAAADTDWTVVYTSTYITGDTSLRKGMVVRNGTYYLDDFLETAGGPSPTVYLSGLGSHPVQLTVYDFTDQSDTDGSSVTLSANAAPAADAGVDQSQGEEDASQGEWTVDFSGTASDDGPNGVYRIEWDFDYDGSTFVPSDETGETATHVYDAIGVYTVAMRVTDHALQSVIDTLTVSLSGGAPPAADAGADRTTEGELWFRFDGTGSTDDYRIYLYVWDFGDGIKGTGPTPAHIYHSPGTYTASLTVSDEAGQTDTDIVTVNVLAAGEGAAPAADAGGPYNAGAGGPPAYFNASASTDDYGIVKYFWDVDDTVDSDGDGDFVNDRDVVGRKPFYIYAAAGSYTVTLTVEDGAGQQASAASTVNVAANLAPDVICVPWRGSDPTIPHDALSGESVRLKGVVRDEGSLEYRWNFGDGSGWTAWTAVADKYEIEADHTYTGAVGTPYTAVLEARDSAGLTGQDFYYLKIGPNNYDTRTNIAIDNGLWYIHKQQVRPSGYWQYSSYYAASTSSSIQAFVINSHVQGGDHQEDPYVETVTTGFEDLFTRIRAYSISGEPAGNPDSNANGIGIEVNSGRRIYEGGPVMDAIASSNTPGAFAYTGPSSVNGRYYLDILRDMADMYAWGQADAGHDRGGWRYSWNSDADNSACQWAAIGMIAAEDNFGVWVPDFVKTENDDYWLWYSYDGTGFGYTGPGNGTAQTPSGMVQLAFDGVYTSDSRWRTAEDYIAKHWVWAGKFYYATYAMVKALRLAQPYPVVTFNATGLDWYNDPVNGLRKYLVDDQESAGSWLASSHAGGSDRDLSTPWVVIMLTPALFTQPPEADAGDDIIWAYDEPLSFDASGSRHLDPLRSIIRYEWDFDGDGVYDFTTSDPADPGATYTYPDPDPDNEGDPPTVYVAKLRVTDDNDPAQSDIDTREVTAAEPPHAPYADAGGPYTATAGIPFDLDGGGSSDIDPGDGITRYAWDLDHDGVFFDDLDLDTDQAVSQWTYSTAGVYNIGLIVEDNGAYNPVGCTIGVNCIPMESLPDFTTVTVVDNQAPTADAGGPYTVNEGDPLTLDGSGSSDPNGDTLYFAWDLDGDGDYDDSTAEQPAYTWMDDGDYTVQLEVTDSLLSDTASAQVTVNDKGPTADFTWTPDPQAEGAAVNFSDASLSYPDSIVLREWDFGGIGTGSGPNPSFVFPEDGLYTVTLRVTDDDGSVDTLSRGVTVVNAPPIADAGGPYSGLEGESVPLDASGSSDPGNDIVSYEWDLDNDGEFDDDTGVNVPFSRTEDGVYPVAVRVTDDDGDFDTDSTTVTVGNAPPVADAGGPYSMVEGGSVVLDASGSTDPGNDIVLYEWDLDDDGAFDDAAGINVSFTTLEDGVYPVSVRVTDDDGASDTDSTTVTVNNAPPTADAGGPYTMEEGGSVVLDASGSSDPGNDIVSYEWDLDDDGEYDDASGVTVSFSAPDNGAYPVSVRVTDDDGASDTNGAEVTVTNVAPSVDAGPDQTVNVGETAAFAGSFTDPGSADTHTITWDFGDGDSASGTLTPSHSYTTAGTYTVTLTVEDDDGGSDSDTLTVTVESSSAPICGDLDHDGDVDGSDRMIFLGAYRKCAGQPGFIAEADYDGDGCVTLNDYREWYRCYKRYLMGG